MFFAAFKSRSCRVPQLGQDQCLVPRLSAASRCPHAEQVLAVGYQRSTATRVRPCRVPCIQERPELRPASPGDRAGQRPLAAMLFTLRSSTAITSILRTRSVQALCRKSLRASATFAWTRATLPLGFAAVLRAALLPGQGIRWYRFSRFSYRSMCLGCGIRCPRWTAPGNRSDPGRRPRFRRWWAAVRVAGTSACRVTNHRPAGSRDTGHRTRIHSGRVDVRPRPHDPQRCRGFRQRQLPVRHPECGPGVGRGLAALAGFKPRVTGPASRKRP